jgi:hypothetical protein
VSHLLVLLLTHRLPVMLVVGAGVLTEVLEKVAGPGFHELLNLLI